MFVLLMLLGLFLPVGAGPVVVATSGTPAVLAGTWKFQPGDDPKRAAAEFDDSGWENLTVPLGWGKQGHRGLGGYAWYRTELRISPAVRDTRLAVSLGFGGIGRYDVFAGGQPIGSRGKAGTVSFLTPAAFSIPKEAIAADGRLVIAVRVWADPGFSGAFPETGGFGDYPTLQTRFFAGPFLIGNETEVRGEVETIYLRLLRTSLPMLAAVVLCAAIAGYHLQLFRRRRELTEYLWFGLLAFIFAINLFFTSPLSDQLTGGTIWGLRFAIATTHVMFVILIQFLWPFLSTPVGRWLRAYQLSNLVIALFSVVAPIHIVILSTRYRFLWLVSFVFVGVGFVTWRAVRGDREARTIWIGIVCLLMASLERFVRQTVQWGDWSPLVSLNLLSGGYVMLVGSMTVSVSNRFSRVFSDLEALTQTLEQKVTERTEELNRKNIQLAENLTQLETARAETERKNRELDQRVEELVASRQQADRIFSALSEALPGTVLDGKYRLDEKIGAGGFGAVFRATHISLGSPIAVKVFKPMPGNESIDAVERFKREGVSASRLNHPNAIRIIDSGISQEGIAYLVMELLNGRTLAEELKIHGRLPVGRCAKILLPVCAALSEAHRLGIIHRDIKPDNIFINRTIEGEVVKVVDFGIAKLLSDFSENEMEKLTVTGAVVGTPMYIAPERIRGLEYDGKSDVYSLGVMLFQMLTGVTPFRSMGESAVAVLMAHITKPPPPLRMIRPDLTEEIEEVVMAALEKNPLVRPTAADLAESFLRAVQNYADSDDEPVGDRFSTASVRQLMTDTNMAGTGMAIEHDAKTLMSSAIFEEEEIPTMISDATSLPNNAISKAESGGKPD